MPTNLKDVLKQKILSHLKAIFARYKILILDDVTKSLLLDCRLSFSEISELGYYAVEQIDAFRKPLKEFEAVYLLCPSDTSVKYVRLEFEADPPLYAAAHILMTSFVSDDMMEELSSAINGTFPLKRLDEINVQFIPFESQVFHLGLTDSMLETYGAKSEEALDNAISKISDKLMDFVLTINDELDIRYYDPSGKRATLSSRLAFNLHERMESMRSFNPRILPVMPQIPYSSSTHDWTNSSVLVMMDRSLDLLAPLLHMLSFQSLMHDFYEVREAVTGEEKHIVCDFNPTLAAVLDESDEIFCKIRHQFYLSSKRVIDKERLEHLQQRNAAKQNVSLEESYDQIQEGFRRVMDLVLHKDAVIQRGNQIAALIQINKSTDEIIETAGMERFFGLEQDLAVGETFDGEELFEPLDEMMDLLNEENEEILPRDKLRILLIYLLTIGGLPRDELDALVSKAKFRQNDPLVLRGLEKLGVILDLKRDPRLPLSPFTFQHRRAAEPLPSAYTSTHEGDRYIPAAYFILRDISLSKPNTFRIFPSLTETIEAEKHPKGIGKLDKNRFLPPITRRGGAGKIARLKGFEPRWAYKNLPVNEEGGAEIMRRNGPRLILFVVGGVTFAEIKVAYELSRMMQREVLIGSTHIITPAEFIEDLYTLGGHTPRHIEAQQKESTIDPQSIGPDPTHPTDPRAPWAPHLDPETTPMGDAWFRHLGATVDPSLPQPGHPGYHKVIPPAPRSVSSLSNSSTMIYDPVSEGRRDSIAKPRFGRIAEVVEKEEEQPVKKGAVAKNIWAEEDEADVSELTFKNEIPSADRVFTSFGRIQDLDTEATASLPDRGVVSDEDEARGWSYTYTAKAFSDDEDGDDDDQASVPTQKPDLPSPISAQKYDANGWEKREEKKPHRRMSAIHRMRQNSMASPVDGGDARDFPIDLRRNSVTSVTSWSYTTTKTHPNDPGTSIWEVEGGVDMPPDRLLEILSAHSPTMAPMQYPPGGMAGYTEFEDVPSFQLPAIHPQRRSSVTVKRGMSMQSLDGYIGEPFTRMPPQPVRVIASPPQPVRVVASPPHGSPLPVMHQPVVQPNDVFPVESGFIEVNGNRVTSPVGSVSYGMTSAPSFRPTAPATRQGSYRGTVTSPPPAQLPPDTHSLTSSTASPPQSIPSHSPPPPSRRLSKHLPATTITIAPVSQDEDWEITMKRMMMSTPDLKQQADLAKLGIKPPQTREDDASKKDWAARNSSLATKEVEEWAAAGEGLFGRRRRRDSRGAASSISKRMPSPPPPSSLVLMGDGDLGGNDPSPPPSSVSSGEGRSVVPPRKVNRVPTKVFYDSVFLEKGKM
ncbi:Syntaxin-binding protein 2 [Dinochytrium kinnereticum]|nr:Syntaxin-binding protein 2 [Dinochytrium kinnereticum]